MKLKIKILFFILLISPLSEILSETKLSQDSKSLLDTSRVNFHSNLGTKNSILNMSDEQNKTNSNLRNEEQEIIVDSYVCTGMTKEMCRENLGEPEMINSAEKDDQFWEQWVYGNILSESYFIVYFINGILETVEYPNSGSQF